MKQAPHTNGEKSRGWNEEKVENRKTKYRNSEEALKQLNG